MKNNDACVEVLKSNLSEQAKIKIIQALKDEPEDDFYDEDYSEDDVILDDCSDCDIFCDSRRE